MAEQPIPFDIPSGINKVDSPNAAKGRFVDADKMRFVAGYAEKWRGWRKFIADQLQGIARGMEAWTNINGGRTAAIGTNTKLYVITGQDKLEDITPQRGSDVSLTDPFTTTNGSAVVTVADNAHGAGVNDTVRFSGATAVGGITIDGPYIITEVIDANSYRITHSSPATSAATGGGSVTAQYDINVGNQSTIVGLGFGAGQYGVGTFSTPRSSGLELELRYWSLDSYKNELLALYNSGTLYLWREGLDARAQPVSNAPAAARAMFVTGERYVFLLGTATPMTVQWADRNDITVWTPADDNTANARELQTGSRLIAGAALAELINLVWSDESLYIFQFIGDESVYDDRLAGQNCGLIAPHAKAIVNQTAYWASTRNFHQYSGSVQDIPRFEELREWVYDNLNQAQQTKCWMGYNQLKRELIFGFPGPGSEEPNLYAACSLHDYAWTNGTLERVAHTIYRRDFGVVLMVGQDGFVYEHEVGADADGQAMNAFLQFGLYVLGAGQVNIDITHFFPDFQRQTGDIELRLATLDRPNSPVETDYEMHTIVPGQDSVETRLDGRYFSFLVRSNTLGGDVRLGIQKMIAQTAGERD